MKKFVSIFLMIAIQIIPLLKICAYQNPLILSDEWPLYSIGDPYIMKYLGIYYLYSSTKDNETGVKCWSTTDLVNWKYEGLCSSDPVTKTAYAPEVVYWNGNFYMYTSPGGNGHYVLKSNSPKGPFTVQTSNLGCGIDGSVFIDDDGQWYFLNSGIEGHTMSSPYSIGKAVSVNANMNGWTEGPCVIKRNGIYYLTYTGNHVISKGYRVNYGTSTTGPLGPYTPSNMNPVLLNTEGNGVGLGHSSTFIGPDLDTYFITYHNLAGDYGVGPFRHLNIDRIAWNGDQMMVLGPTTFTQPNPALPDFYDYFNRTTIGSNWTNVGGGNWGIYNNQLMWQNTTGSSNWYKQISTASTETNYTAEFNTKEMQKGTTSSPRFGAVFSYKDENNYGVALLSSKNNRLETWFKVNGVDQGWQNSTLPAGYDYTQWHCIRVEKSGSTFKVFVDNMLKQTRNSIGLNGGHVGYMTEDTHADFGFVAFSNKVNGSGIFDAAKPIPGTIAAVHYNTGGEGVAYHDTTPGNAGGYRADDVDIKANPEGGYSITSSTAGEWYKYNVNVAQTGTYSVGIRYAASNKSCKVRIWMDSADVSGIFSLPSTEGFNNNQTFTVKGLNLTSGVHTLKVEMIEGDFDLYAMKFVAGDYTQNAISDSFNGSFSSLWNYSDGGWTVENNEANMDGCGKRTMGSAGRSDYTVEADIKGITGLNTGIIFRVTNPSLGGAGNDPNAGTDFYQGYFAGLDTNKVILGKGNYNWTQLAAGSATVTTNVWYHMKVVVKGSNIKVYLDDMNTPKIDYTDSNPFISGKAGLRTCYSHAHFKNFSMSGEMIDKTPVPTLTPSLTPTPTPSKAPVLSESPSNSAASIPTPSSSFDYDFNVNTVFSPDQLAPNQYITAKVTATNVSATPYTGVKDVLLIAALYDGNNTMQNISFISKGISFLGTETLSAGFKLPADLTGYSVKAFMWDGSDLKDTNMIPISNVEEKRIAKVKVCRA